MSTKIALSSFLKRATVLTSLLLVTLLSFSCKSDDGESGGNPNEKNIKLTITTNGVIEEDFAIFTATGSVAKNPLEGTIWKLNGTVKSNEPIISLEAKDFTGGVKTYVIESANPLAIAQVGIQFSASEKRSYTVSYKAEVNGKVVKEDNNITVNKDKEYSHIFSY
ncbi:hypothetical protein [Flavobacterium sp. HSC-61S13]|uniref:hypothetical protein n=1 Tax=Flavobacterium sp. HSC-61S13 TaxID=2910963 RepID=UPI0020A1BD5E|nr:hypothetical protein [Flavobacterium sp. HSC-61S13]MCP1995587.1 hypothetical protein [Flavobacterium sp. HSC-61S13]